MSSCSVSDGARSSAHRITGSSASKLPETVPVKLLITRRATSLISAARACIYGSSIAASIAENCSPACSTAYSALQNSSSSNSEMQATKSSSSTNIAWVSNKTTASSASSRHFSASSFSCLTDSACAAFNLLFSIPVSSTVCFSMWVFGRRKKYSDPFAIPAETPFP